MNTQSKLVTGVLGMMAAVGLILGFVAINKSVVVNNQPQQQYGSVTGPDSSFPRESHNGVAKNFAYVGFQLASSTICGIKSPPVDTKLVHWGATFSTLPAYATSFMLGFGGQTSTSTSLIAVTQIAYASGATNKTVSASTTAEIMIPANSWVNLNVSTSTGSTVTASGFPITGHCVAEFAEL